MTARTPSSRAGLGAWAREPRTAVVPADVLPVGAPESFVIAAEAQSAPVPIEFPPHTHPVHELVWVRGGTLTARIGDRIMTAAAGHGLWIPAGLVHAGRLTAGVLLCDAFFTPEACPVEFDGPTVIEVTPVLESLLIRLAHDDLDPAQRARTEAVVFDVLAPAPRQFALRVPGDARVDRIAQALLDDPGDPRSAEDWARETGLSTRTISRAFLAGTGLSFGRWRQALRIQTALTLLAEGTSVKDTADLLGYAQTSTFIESFRRAVGTTPGTFVSENPYPAS